jgi:hypothetical protein
MYLADTLPKAYCQRPAVEGLLPKGRAEVIGP